MILNQADQRICMLCCGASFGHQQSQVFDSYGFFHRIVSEHIISYHTSDKSQHCLMCLYYDCDGRHFARVQLFGAYPKSC